MSDSYKFVIGSNPPQMAYCICGYIMGLSAKDTTLGMPKISIVSINVESNDRWGVLYGKLEDCRLADVGAYMKEQGMEEMLKDIWAFESKIGDYRIILCNRGEIPTDEPLKEILYVGGVCDDGFTLNNIPSGLDVVRYFTFKQYQ